MLILCLESYTTETYDLSIYRFLFTGRMPSLQTIIVNEPDGIILFKSLIPHENLRYIDITLETIDDLYILLDGLVPNVEKMFIQISQSRVLCKYQ